MLSRRQDYNTVIIGVIQVGRGLGRQVSAAGSRDRSDYA